MYVDEEVESLSFFDIIHPDYIYPYEEVLQKAILQGRTNQVEMVFIAKNLTPVYVEGRISCKFDDQGKPVSISGIFQDITNQKEIEQSRLLVKLSQYIPGAIYQYLIKADGTSCFPFVSEGVQELLEVSASQIKEDSSLMFDRIYEEDYDNIMESIRNSYENLSIWENECRVVLPEKKLRWIRGVARPEKLVDGSVLWYGYLIDITERKQVEAWNNYLSTAMVNISDSVMITDHEFNITYINKRAEELFGYKLEEIENLKAGKSVR